MELLAKIKLARRDAEQERRRQQALADLERWGVIGKQTLLDRPEAFGDPTPSVADHGTNGAAYRPGALSRVLFEAATGLDPTDRPPSSRPSDVASGGFAERDHA